MAQSIKLGSDTYLDASNVMMNASNRTRKPLSKYICEGGIQQIGVADGSTVNITVDATDTTTLRSFVVSVAASSAGNGMYSWIRTSSSTNQFYSIHAASGLTFTHTGANKFSITNSSGAYAMLFFFLGNPMKLTYT